MNRTLETLLVPVAVATAAAVTAYAFYKTRRQWIGRALNLPPAHYEVGVETHLRVPMPDGLSLEAEHYFPKAEGSFPTILIRTPYGLSTDNTRINTIIVNFPVQRFVERGYHVVVQSVRGRFGSEGRWIPFVDEEADGRATLDWISRQPWFNGSLGLFGSSYVGYCGEGAVFRKGHGGLDYHIHPDCSVLPCRWHAGSGHDGALDAAHTRSRLHAVSTRPAVAHHITRTRSIFAQSVRSSAAH
jgi:alpha/beta superfamily hydrolase